MNTEPRIETPDVDVVVVGAGMAGLYMLHRLRGEGMSAVVLETAGDVGGTWYWNRYPGARCDIQSLDYQYTFDPELEAEWQWTEKYATQPEILRYLQHVAERYDLRRDIRFSTKVKSATWDEGASLWRLRTERLDDADRDSDGPHGDEVSCRFYVMATGCLSMPKEPEIAGADRFRGEVYTTGRWPHEGVDFTGKKVAVIGTGSSGIQSIPPIAQQARELVVFQRTPNYSMPAGNGPIPADKRAALEADRAAYHEAARFSQAGVPVAVPTEGVLAVSEDERLRRFEVAWQKGELLAPGEAFNDLITNADANDAFAEFVRDKIRSVVDDPKTAELLCPKDYPFATKRPCLDTRYFETFNLPHVRLVDLRTSPIQAITEDGIRFGDADAAGTESLSFDAIVYATGFDAMTGALVGVDIQGRDGVTLKDKWKDGPHTYLGLTTVGFPNLFMITGPGSPSVLSNMVVSIEQHVDWIADCLADLREHGHTTIEPTTTAEAAWGQHVNDCADITLFPRAASWYMGANVPGKPRVFLPYIGGVATYRETCDRVMKEGYLGFRLSGPSGEQCRDGVVNRLQPDVAVLLQLIADLALPPMETLSADEARALSNTLNEGRPSGPEVGEVTDGNFPGPAGELGYRLYRPASPGPHPVVCYFHGGGWVLGAPDSDDPFCRDLCARSEALIVSVDYRHAPESRFPAAADDAFAAVAWIAEHARELGGLPGSLVLAGWSAGGNLAAVACQRALAAGGPEIAGQLLVAPVVDCDLARGSYQDNADGYILTTALMAWFWNHYADESERTDPMASPLRAASLSGLPPAAIFTCELDPLRDEGIAYAQALADAGVEVEHHACRGHIHTSLHAVDLILSGAPIRAEMAAAIRRFSSALVSA